MKKKIKSGVCLLFFMAGLPCLIVALILGIKECPPVRNETDFEDYIAVLTAMQIDWEAPKESIKAQTVIARGNFYLQWEKGEEKQKAEEAAKYFRIGESKLRKLAEENPVPDWVMMNGNRIQIKRKQFEKMIDTVDAI